MSLINKTLKNKLMLVLICVMTIYTSYLVYGQTIIGVDYWDIFVYLENAMLFSHVNIGSQLSVPPILSILTSIPFQLGFISENSLFVISGILFIFLVIGVYLLFCERFDPKISFIGSLLFSTLSLVVSWAVTGANDVPALTFGVWAFYFTVRGVNSSFKYFYLAFLCFILAFFTRFTEGFILLLMLAYLFLNKEKLSQIMSKNDIKRFILFLVLLGVLISGIYIIYQGNLPFVSQFFEVSNSNQVSTANPGYNLNPLYYIINLPQFLTSMHIEPQYDIYLTTVFNQPTLLSYVYLIFMVVGIGYIIKCMFTKKDQEVIKNKWLKISFVLILSSITLLTYSHISYLITEVLYISMLLIVYKWIPDRINKLDLIMLLWLGMFYILHSYHPVKVDRYIIPALVPIMYYILIGIKKTTEKIHFKNMQVPLIVLTILLILMVPITIGYTQSIQHQNPQTGLEKNAAEWIKQYDTNYTKINISSDRGVAMSWYLKKYTYTTIPRVLEGNNQTLENKLKSINAKYYIDSTSNTTYIQGYHEIYQKQLNNTFKIKIYQKN